MMRCWRWGKPRLGGVTVGGNEDGKDRSLSHLIRSIDKAFKKGKDESARAAVGWIALTDKTCRYDHWCMRLTTSRNSSLSHPIKVAALTNGHWLISMGIIINRDLVDRSIIICMTVDERKQGI